MASPFDLTTAAAVQADLNTSADVAAVVTAASRMCWAAMGRTGDVLPYRQASITESVYGFGRPLLLLSCTPVVSVASVTYNGVAYDSTAYEVADAAAGMLRRIGCMWPDTRPYAGYHGGLAPLPELADNPNSGGLVVTYSAGWVTPGQYALTPSAYPGGVTVPEDVQEAALLAALHLKRRRGTDVMLASESLGPWSASYRDFRDFGQVLPADVLGMLEPHALRRML